VVEGDVQVMEGFIPREQVINMLLDLRNGVSNIPSDCSYTISTTLDMIDLKLKELTK
jgi:hypothetical protein